MFVYINYKRLCFKLNNKDVFLGFKEREKLFNVVDDSMSENLNCIIRLFNIRDIFLVGMGNFYIYLGR